MDHSQTDLASYIHAVLNMHMPLHDDPNLRFAQTEQIANLIAAKLDQLRRHSSRTVDNTQYPVVILSQPEYELLRSDLQQSQARRIELSWRLMQETPNRGLLEQTRSSLEEKKAQVLELQSEIRWLKAEYFRRPVSSVEENEDEDEDAEEEEEQQFPTGMKISNR